MNHWLKMSIEYANQKSYLDDLFSIYPTIPDGIREIDQTKWSTIEKYYNRKDNVALINSLLELELFPIKDSYIAYLRWDQESIYRNPKTVNRIAGRLYEMGLDKIFQKATEPKETNRKIGPMFKNWINSKALGITPCGIKTFISSTNDAILDASDIQMKEFAKNELGYNHNKGLDFVARFNSKYIIGEAKFLSDYGGNQSSQFNDAMSVICTKGVNAQKIAILDGVLYIRGRAMHKNLITTYKHHNIMSTLVLREFLYAI